MDKRVVTVVAVVAAAALLGGGWYLWQSRQATPPYSPPEAQAPAAPAAAPPAEASAPAIRHPVEETQAEAEGPLGALDAAALATLLGQKAVLQFLQADGFAARVVATVDNLPRPHAAPRLWPVNPMPGRFTVERGGAGAERIAVANAQRYAPFVRFVEGIDSTRAATLYFRHYKQFQQAYVELGYPRGYFNDRLVEVIDHLLATPEVPASPAVQLVEIKGSTPSTQPWTHYEFVDAGLQGLSSGQKMLVRLGPEQARRIKVKLAEFRRLVAKASR